MPSKLEEHKVASPDALQTMFRVSGRNQIQLIAIADNKANMITAICTSVIFLIIILLSFGSFFDNEALMKIEIIIPLCILIGFCLVSIICAILALKPKIIRAKKKGRSALFFHNFYRKTLEEYKDQMNTVAKSEETIHEQLLTDMYHNGLVLQRKYTLLSFAYSLFLIAIVLSVFSFIVLSVS